MSRLPLRAWLAACCLLPALALAVPRNAPVPGGIAVVELPASGEAAPAAWFSGSPLLVLRNDGVWKALIGLPITLEPGQHALEWAANDSGARQQIVFRVTEKQYPTQALKVAPKYVEPDAETLERIARERAEVDALKLRRSTEVPAQAELAAPAAGPLSSRFGLRRVFNGQPRSPHLGLDIAAPAGTPVRAPAAAVVAGVGDYFFWGRFVALDHGHGLITLYAHLSEVAVQPGQRLARGEVLGAIGATGRVTGAHLHWTVVLNGVSVDPELFLGER